MSLVPVPEPSASGEQRPPREGLPGVVQWLCEQTPEAVTQQANTTDVHHMAEEKRRFLANVLSSMQKDYLADIKAALAVATDASSSQEERQEALEIIADECEDINIAADFAKLGGFAPVMSFLKDASPELQWRAADVVASLTQNCPAGLEKAKEHGFLQLIMPLLDSAHDKVRLKGLRAVSCMVRGDNALAEELARDATRVAAVVGCVRPPSPVRVQVKAAHLLRHLVQSSSQVCSLALNDEGLLSALSVALQGSEDAQLWEHGLHLLVSLSRRRNSLVADLQRESPALMERMADRRTVLHALPQEDKDAHREEIDYMTTLLGAMQA